jgi:hypothetical protein
MIRFADPTRVVLRAVAYLAILVGVAVVSEVTASAPPAFIYQGF